METWRRRLLLAVLAGSLGGYLWMLVASPHLRRSLILLSVLFVLGTGLGVVLRWQRLSERVIASRVALAAIVHLALAALLVAADRIWELGPMPAVGANWQHFLIGALGITAALLTWRRARAVNGGQPVPVPRGDPEPAPSPTAELETAPAWEDHKADLAAMGDETRLRQLRTLERLEAVLGQEGHAEENVANALRVVRQEARRLADEAVAGQREEEDDVLSQAAFLLEWGAQKIPEIADMDVSDLLLARVVADIRTQHSRIEHVFVDHRELEAIHLIDRAPAEAKCRARVQAARDALPILRANGMRLSEELIAAHDELAPFRSVTGFQVVQLDDGTYVMFEGNSRREALQRAFGDEQGVLIEVRLYRFDDPARWAPIQRRLERVRRRKGLGEPAAAEAADPEPTAPAVR